MNKAPTTSRRDVYNWIQHQDDELDSTSNFVVALFMAALVGSCVLLAFSFGHNTRQGAVERVGYAHGGQ